MSDPPHETPPERDALVVAARTDRDAFGELFEAYHDLVLGYCHRRLFRQATAEDVCSEVFLYVARKIRVFPGETERDFRCWLYRIATNEVNAHVRKTKRRGELLDEAVDKRRLPHTEPPHQETAESLDWPAVAQAIERLKQREQTVLTLRLFDGLPYDEIGQILGIKPATARVTYSRAIARLRVTLDAAPTAPNHAAP